MLADVQHAIASRPRDQRLVLLSDYDGTLAEFHPDPAAAWPSAHTRDLLCRLAARDDLSLGIVSVRRVSDLRTRTQLPGRVYLAGLHGMEIEVRALRCQHPDLDAARHGARVLREQLEEVRAQVPGLLLEDKDASIAVHVRAVAPDARESALTLADDCAAPLVESGQLRRLIGNMVLEFLPNIACHKGDATRWIAADIEVRCQRRPWIVFVGDDVTDEDAFQAISSGIGVLVGRRTSAAQYQLDSTSQVEALLDWVLREG
jgi:trehalose 6-phosphate phosphatase